MTLSLGVGSVGTLIRTGKNRDYRESVEAAGVLTGAQMHARSPLKKQTMGEEKGVGR